MKETNEYYNQRILCEVQECKYHEKEENRCTLGKIMINGQKKKEDTFCDSFQRKE